MFWFEIYQHRCIFAIRFIGDPKNDELWEGKGSRFDALWDRKSLNVCPFPSHNAAFFGSPINLIMECPLFIITVHYVPDFFIWRILQKICLFFLTLYLGTLTVFVIIGSIPSLHVGRKCMVVKMF